MPSQHISVNLPFNGSGAALNADIVPSFDCTNYRSGSIQLGGFGSATVSLQLSNDNSTWLTVRTRFVSTGIWSTTHMQVAGIFAFELPAVGFCRIRITAYTSGTITGVGTFSSLPANPDSWVNVAQISGVGADAPNSDAKAFGGFTYLGTVDVPYKYDSAANAWNRDRNVNALSIISSNNRTVDISSSDQINYNWKGMALTLNVSAQAGGSVKLNLQLKDSISGNYVTVWTATAAQTAVGTYTYLFYPGALDAASWTEKVQLALAMRTWRITTTTANGSGITYSVSADMLL